MSTEYNRCHGWKLEKVWRVRKDDGARVFALEFVECGGVPIADSQYCSVCWGWARARYTLGDRDRDTGRG